MYENLELWRDFAEKIHLDCSLWKALCKMWYAHECLNNKKQKHTHTHTHTHTLM